VTGSQINYIIVTKIVESHYILNITAETLRGWSVAPTAGSKVDSKLLTQRALSQCIIPGIEECVCMYVCMYVELWNKSSLLAFSVYFAFENCAWCVTSAWALNCGK
jgi:hypothetical protein